MTVECRRNKVLLIIQYEINMIAVLMVLCFAIYSCGSVGKGK